VDKQKLDASSNIALAALLHDLGKMAERGKIPVSRETLDNNKHLYCPFHKEGGWFSHVHAAYSAIGIDLIEQWLPDLKKDKAYPFGGWSDEGAGGIDDSLINGAAKHHRPDTALQWIIAAADRLASGFEREEFANYNKAREKPETGRNHYQARQLSLYEQINVRNVTTPPSVGDLKFRYKLSPMSAA
jgi:CRISPR-associated protein Csm1